MKTFGSTVGREPTGGSLGEGLTAASTELMLTLAAGEVETTSSGQTEDQLTPGTLNAVEAEQGGAVDRTVLLLPQSELLTGLILMLRRPW